MRLQELLATCFRSAAGDWAVAHTRHVESRHPYHATYVHDVAVGLDWGAIVVERFSNEWTRRFPDEEARSVHAEVTYCGSIAYQVSLAIVDGGRAYLPLPAPAPIDHGGSEVFPVWRWQIDFARLIDRLSGGWDYESYLERAGFVIRTEAHEFIPESTDVDRHAELESEFLYVWETLSPYVDATRPDARRSDHWRMYSPQQLHLIKRWVDLFREEIREVQAVRNSLAAGRRLARPQLVEAIDTARKLRSLLEAQLLGEGPAA